MRTFKRNSTNRYGLFYIESSYDDLDLNPSLERTEIEWEDADLDGEDLYNEDTDRYIEDIERYK